MIYNGCVANVAGNSISSMPKADAQQYFASLIALSKEQGLIGHVLRRYPEWLLREADRRAEQTSDHRRRHQEPGRLPLPDPWRLLLDAPAVSLPDKVLFLAAQSQLPAMQHLIHIAEGIATLNTDWYQEAIDAGTIGDKHAIAKVASVHVFNERVQKMVRAQKNAELLKQMEILLKQERKRLIHSGEKDKIERLKKWPSWEEFREHNKLPVILAEWWVRSGVNGAPGLMFWRNEALTNFLKIHLDQTNISPLTVKKIRQQLGLIPVSEKNHFVWNVSIETDNAGKRNIKGFSRYGHQSFSGEISRNKQISPAVMTAFAGL
jgi:hypothetical protein